MRLLFVYILLYLCVREVVPMIASVELQVPLTKLMAYDCQTDGHSIVVRESSFDGIPISDGEVIFDYILPEGVLWKDIKFRTNMGSLFITVPVMHPTMYTIKTISESGVLI